MTTPDELADFYADFGCHRGATTATSPRWEEVRRRPPPPRPAFTARRDDAVTIVNDLFRDAQALPQLRRHDGLDWHPHAIDPERLLAERIVVETAMAMIDVIRADEMSRLAICADDTCAGVVLDLPATARSGSARFTCGNCNAVAWRTAPARRPPENARNAR